MIWDGCKLKLEGDLSVESKTSSLTLSGIVRPGWKRLQVFLLWTMDRNIDALELMVTRCYKMVSEVELESCSRFGWGEKER